jgi:hypothetical protein
MHFLISAGALLLLLQGCGATTSSGVRPAFVSPYDYNNHTCAQLHAVAKDAAAREQRLTAAMDRISGSQSGGFVSATVHAPELSMARGQREVVEELIVNRRCPPPG